MPQHLVISIRFLQPWFHGRTEIHEPEWPPAPLRVFQALVAAASHHWQPSDCDASPLSALQWLELQPPPLVIACPAVPASTGYRAFVPDNVGDLVTAQWAGGKEANIAEFRTEKDIRPSHLLEDGAVHVVYPIASGDTDHLAVIRQAARCMTHLGWGIDQVAGDACIIEDSKLDQIAGERWRPTTVQTPIRQRVPIPGTLTDLSHRHAGFLARLGPQGFTPVPSLTAFAVIGYRRGTDPISSAWTAFALRRGNGRGFHAFNPVRRTREIAGMVRHAVAEAAQRQGWDQARINTFIHGKSADGSRLAKGIQSPDRFQYLPLPTIVPQQGVGTIRRIVIAAPPGCAHEVHWVAQALAGVQLRPEGAPVGNGPMLVPLTGEFILNNYTNAATTWTSVTPVILSGFDDRKSAKTERLIREALVQAGFARELVAQTGVGWQGVGFLPGVDLASRYLPPENLDQRPRYHVRLEFPTPILGPIAVGAGRFRGFGVFTAMSNTSSSTHPTNRNPAETYPANT